MAKFATFIGVPRGFSGGVSAGGRPAARSEEPSSAQLATAWGGEDLVRNEWKLVRGFMICYNNVLAWFKTYEFIYGASPAAGCAARAREHLTRARARCASNDRRARETREQIEARARGARARPRCARVFARAPVRHARAQISSPRAQISSPNRK